MEKTAVIFEIINESNRGNFLRANIYADANKQNLCGCGGKFNKYVEFEDTNIFHPICPYCGAKPSRYRIHGRVEDEFGNKKTVVIRYNQRSKRLDRLARVVDTLEVIREQLQEGEFNYIHYMPDKKKRVLQFSVFVNEIFLPETKARWESGEISKSTWRNYSKESKHLCAHFKKTDLDKINNVALRNFHRSYKASVETKNRCHAILKTILNEAIKKGIRSRPMKLDNAKATRKRKEIMDYDTAKLIWSHIEDPIHKDVVETLLLYPIRPSEVYVLKTKEDFDLSENKIIFDEHLSDGEKTAGRKSQKGDQKYSTLKLPLLDRMKEIYDRNRDMSHPYLFKGIRGKRVSEQSVRRSWRKAREKAGIFPTSNCKFDMYEIKHALTSYLLKNGVDAKTLEEMSGVNAKTLMERYLYAQKDSVSEAFNILQFKSQDVVNL